MTAAITHTIKWFPAYFMAIIAAASFLGATLFSSARDRAEFRRMGALTWLLVLFVVWLISAFGFQVVLYGLWKDGIVDFDRQVSDARLTGLLAWQAVNMIPVVDVDEIFRWKSPLPYSESGAGVVVLAYKLFVVLPLLGFIRMLWQIHTTPPVEAANSGDAGASGRT